MIVGVRRVSGDEHTIGTLSEFKALMDDGQWSESEGCTESQAFVERMCMLADFLGICSRFTVLGPNGERTLYDVHPEMAEVEEIEPILSYRWDRREYILQKERLGQDAIFPRFKTRPTRHSLMDMVFVEEIPRDVLELQTPVQ
jgi:hypothetical protein